MQAKLNVAIVGHGFVGKAVEYGFRNDRTNIYLVDPNHGTTVKSMTEFFTPDVVFVAVPTPMSDDGKIDSSIIESVFIDLTFYGVECLVVVKSTVTPAVIVDLSNKYSNLAFNPEFLTERNANIDFVTADLLVIGADSGTGRHALLEHIYDDFSNCRKCDVHHTDLIGAAMVKYTINSFLASKVLFMNQMHDVFLKSGTNSSWDEFTSILKSDKRVGVTHMSVPGPDGRYGFGGACFTKDTGAMVTYAESVGVDFTQLKETIRANQKIRNQYTELDDREKAQNVTFGLKL